MSRRSKLVSGLFAAALAGAGGAAWRGLARSSNQPSAPAAGARIAAEVESPPAVLATIEQRVERRFGRLAAPEVPPILNAPAPRTMTAIVTAATQENGGDPRAAERTLRAAIAVEADLAVRQTLLLRVADALLVQKTPEARREAAALLDDLGHQASTFFVQVNALTALDRLEAEPQ